MNTPNSSEKVSGIGKRDKVLLLVAVTLFALVIAVVSLLHTGAIDVEVVNPNPTHVVAQNEEEPSIIFVDNFTYQVRGFANHPISIRDFVVEVGENVELLEFSLSGDLSHDVLMVQHSFSGEINHVIDFDLAFIKAGEFLVNFTLFDINGDELENVVVVFLIEPDITKAIEGIETFEGAYVLQGSTDIDWLHGITYDENVIRRIIVDDSSVDLSTPAYYVLTYTIVPAPAKWERYFSYCNYSLMYVAIPVYTPPIGETRVEIYREDNYAVLPEVTIQVTIAVVDEITKEFIIDQGGFVIIDNNEIICFDTFIVEDDEDEDVDEDEEDDEEDETPGSNGYYIPVTPPTQLPPVQQPPVQQPPAQPPQEPPVQQPPPEPPPDPDPDPGPDPEGED